MPFLFPFLFIQIPLRLQFESTSKFELDFDSIFSDTKLNHYLERLKEVLLLLSQSVNFENICDLAKLLPKFSYFDDNSKIALFNLVKFHLKDLVSEHFHSLASVNDQPVEYYLLTTLLYRLKRYPIDGDIYNEVLLRILTLPDWLE